MSGLGSNMAQLQILEQLLGQLPGNEVPWQALSGNEVPWQALSGNEVPWQKLLSGKDVPWQGPLSGSEVPWQGPSAPLPPPPGYASAGQGNFGSPELDQYRESLQQLHEEKARLVPSGDDQYASQGNFDVVPDWEVSPENKRNQESLQQSHDEYSQQWELDSANNDRLSQDLAFLGIDPEVYASAGQGNFGSPELDQYRESLQQLHEEKAQLQALDNRLPVEAQKPPVEAQRPVDGVEVPVDDSEVPLSEDAINELIDRKLAELREKYPNLSEDQLREKIPWSQDPSGSWIPGSGEIGGGGAGDTGGGGGGGAGDTGGGRGEITGISKDGRAMYEDGSIGDKKLTQKQLNNLRQTGSIDGKPVGGQVQDTGGGGQGQVQGGESQWQHGVDGFGAPGGMGPPMFLGGDGPPPADIPTTIGGPVGTTDPGPLGGPQGDAGAIFDTLLNTTEQANKDANQANEDRYNDILEGYLARIRGWDESIDKTSTGLGGAQGVMADRWNRVGDVLRRGEGNLGQQFKNTQDRLAEQEQALMNMLSGLGGQERKDIDKRFEQDFARTTQSATDRGLANTSILDSLYRGNREDQEASHLRLGDAIAMREVGQGNQSINRDYGLSTIGLGQKENEIVRQSAYDTQGHLFGQNTIQQQLDLDQKHREGKATLSGDPLRVMENKIEQGPDLSMLVNLANTFGAGGSGDYDPRPLGQQYTVN